MTENKKIIKEWHGESHYPTCKVKIELFEDGQLIETLTDRYSNSIVTFDKKYKSLYYAKKKLDRMRDNFLHSTYRADAF